MALTVRRHRRTAILFDYLPPDHRPRECCSNSFRARRDLYVRVFESLKQFTFGDKDADAKKVVLEMVEGGDRDIAKTLLESMPLQVLQNDHPIRSQLVHLL